MQPGGDNLIGQEQLKSLEYLESLKVLESYQPPSSEQLVATVMLVVMLAFMIEYSVVFIVDILRSSFDFFGDADEAPGTESSQELMTRRVVAIIFSVITVLLLRLDLMAIALSETTWTPLGLFSTALIMSAGGWASLTAAARFLHVPMPQRSET